VSLELTFSYAFCCSLLSSVSVFRYLAELYLSQMSSLSEENTSSHTIGCGALYFYIIVLVQRIDLPYGN